MIGLGVGHGRAAGRSTGRWTAHGAARTTVRATTLLAGAVLLGFWAVGCGSDAPTEPGDPGGGGSGSVTPYQGTVATITSAELRDLVEALADDSTLGRDAPSPEIEEVALYIQDLFAKAGLRPGGENGGWFQRFPIAGTTAPNVIGWVEGSDPDLRDEYVVYTAHFDHLGYAPKTAPGLDSVYNGADDNASGTAALLELAEAFGAMPVKPLRSVVFLAVSGEEDGLVGSNYYAAHPTFPMALARANVNMDMIGRNDPGLIQAIRGPVSTIAGTVADVAAASPALGLTVQDIEDLSLMQRSDVWAFYGSGVDAVFLHSGLHADYHQRTDEPQYLNYDKMERVARLAYLAGVQSAGVPQ